MNTNTLNRIYQARRWTQRLAAGLSCVAVVGCGGGGDDASTTPETPAAAPTQLLSTQTMSGSSAAAIGPERYNRVVYQLYLAYYGRPPDPIGLAHYSTQLSALGVQPNLNALVSDYQKKKSKVRELIDSFAASAESKSMYTGNTKQFVTQLYRTILGRAPDPGATDFWGDLIDAGKLPRSLAALALMSGAAASNNDAAAIDKKLEASGKFTAAIQELQLSSVYIDKAIGTGRNLLNSVTSTTDANSLTTSVAASITMLSPPKRAATLSSIAPDAVTDLRIENVEGVAHTSVPFTFGQPFAPGHLAASDQLIGRLENGSTISLQVDVKATHADGSVRHAIISGVLPNLAAFATARIDLLKANVAGTSPTNSATSSTPANFSSRVELVLDGVKYSANLADAISAGNAVKWLAGPIANETLYSTPFKSASGIKHPHLTARFDVRAYSQLDNQVRVDVVVENVSTFTPGQRNYTYDVQLMVNDREVYSHRALTHYHHARWHKTVWSTSSGTSPVHVMHNTGYLIATKAVPNYDQTIVPKEATLAGFATQLTADLIGPMKIGPVKAYMPTTGGRPDIGPLPSWSVSYLLSMDRRARNSMMALADGSGSWSMHYRDENTGHPVRLDNATNKYISTHPNLGHKGPLPVPRCANNDRTLCATPYTHDSAHQPSLAFLPYLLTGDYYYLEELQFWAAWNPTSTDPSNSGLGQGLVRWQELRGQSWSMRTLGQVAYVTPDSHALKGYFQKMLDNNLNWYHQTYVVGNPNALGMYDGSGQSAFIPNGSAPWQDDFFTWSVGYLNELGFAKAQPILNWKAKYPVGRLTTPGFCWTDGSAYWLKTREVDNGPVYGSFAALYAATFKNNMIKDDNRKLITHPAGLLYLDQPCGSQAQADWFTAATGYTWQKGQMTGYSTSEGGYPSNLQPALAIAVSTGIPNAGAAWNVFMSRSAKPDYTKGPQFAIIPR